MQRGLLAPLSGDYMNPWLHSNGAWIRTEIWASLAPACPEIAAKYAIEDAKVDHGAGEGTVAAAFVAAMQSAAYAVADVRTCVEIGLTQIPENSRVALSVKKVLECFDNGMSAMDCRNTILKMNADIGDGWFEAPSNVAYTVLGLIYGKGDFKKSMITAINCGDDTDCIGATVGSTLGIIYGLKGIPADMEAHYALAKRAATESAVLLKNDGRLLPLSPDDDVVFIGQMARNMRYQGAGSSHINPWKLTSPCDACPDIPFYEIYAEDGEPNAALLREAVSAAGKARSRI
ncbi:MAG: ADP-ribosylglycohydrolase family protein [Clostridia bacterium]|nr:ADP-ribosylglycohydrolase family protein [Clostridia bacterium]